MSPNCTDTKEYLASDVIWDDPPGSRLAVLLVGLSFGLLTLILYAVLIARHANRGRRMVRGEKNEHRIGIGFIPAKIRIQEQVLYLGPAMTVLFGVQMCAPELATMAEVFQTVGRALVYYFLLQYMRHQFGFEWNIVATDGTGTLQQHKPCKIWNKPPCCCVWVFFLPCMTDRIIGESDLRMVGRLVKQYIVIGPVTAAIKMVVQYEGVNPDRAATVFQVCNIFSIVSVLCAVYGFQVAMAACENVIPIQYQLAQRSWFKASDECKAKERMPLKNLSPKNQWIVVLTVLPILASLIASAIVTEGFCTESGKLLNIKDLRCYVDGFLGILVNFLGVLFATFKAFPVATIEGDRAEVVEHLSACYMEMEKWPAFCLERIPPSIAALLEERAKQGKDPNLGVTPSVQFMDAFVSPNSDGPGQTVIGSASPKESI